MPEPIPVDERVRGLSNFPNQFHQVAMYCRDTTAQRVAMNLWMDMGHGDWIIDYATLSGVIVDPDGVARHSQVRARMAFNYTVMPMELEFLTYKSGLNRHSITGMDQQPGGPFISHMSTYTDDMIGQIEAIRDNQGLMPYHRFVTEDHTNPAVVGKKRFVEAIYDTTVRLGYDIKFIQKVPWNYGADKYLENTIFADAYSG